VKNNNISIRQVRFWLFAGLIIFAPLSKYPSFALPMFNFSSFRIGLYQVLAVIFIISCIASFKWDFFKAQKMYLVGLISIATPLLLGFIWAIDTKRWFLLASSIAVLLALFIASWWYVANELTAYKIKLLLKITLYFGIIYSVLVIIQLLFSTLTTESFGLLCEKCTKAVFGFPRVNLFAAEPLFLANSLLPFFFIALYALYLNKTKLAIWSLSLVSLAIGLTFSRGAFAGVAVGLIAFYASLLIAKKLTVKFTLKSIAYIVLGFVVSFIMLIGSASYTYKGTPNIAYNTTKTMLEQLSLGAINLLDKTVPTATQAQNDPADDFVSPGLIEASTTERLTDAQLAIKAWSYNAKNIVFGVGSGNLGPFVVKNIEPSVPNNLTVYIFYVLALVEIGILGLFGILLIFGLSLYKLTILAKKQYSAVAVPIAILIAFLVQYFFFGSYINVVYIWLWMGISAGIAVLSQKHLSKLLK
jgi:hypothetical protein